MDRFQLPGSAGPGGGEGSKFVIVVYTTRHQQVFDTMTLSLDYAIQRVIKMDDSLREYILAAYRALFGHLCDVDKIPQDVKAFETCYHDPSGCFLVCREDNKILGMIGYLPFDRRFRRLDGTVRPELSYSQNTAVEVVRLFVTPSFRSRGLATALIDALVSEAKNANVDVMYLHTHDFLSGARQLWIKSGWRLVAQDADEPWKSIHMERDLKDERRKHVPA